MDVNRQNHPDPSLRCVLWFVKAPETGCVKTRLASELPWDVVVELYACFLTDMLNTLETYAPRIRICYSPAQASIRIRHLLGPHHDYMPQQGRDIGERMKHAFIRAFSDGFHHVLLLGSDIPGISDSILKEAHLRLTDHDTVIGPAADGGFYLVGFKPDTFTPEIFEHMPWSTNRILALTLARLKSKNLQVHRLPVCLDIDKPEDLKSFVRRASKRPIPHSQTMAYLQRIGYAKEAEK